ncbi:MAG: GWxTD domain-containing protein [Bacteroidales bacterium]|nr:GWxTD domain-containing protein [Bacteroidales bacterium]
MKKTILILTISMLLIMMFGCAPSNKMTYENLAYLYKSERGRPAIQFRPFNVSDSVTRIYFKTKMQDYLYAREKPGEPFQAKIQVHFELYDSFESDEIIDSASLEYTDSRHYKKDYKLIEYFNVNAEFEDDYILVIDLKDMNRGYTYTTIHEIYKSSYSDPHYFIPLTPKGNPIFVNYFSSGQPFQLKCGAPEHEQIYMGYYSDRLPVPPPPFKIDETSGDINYEADTTYPIMLTNNRQTEILTLDKPGFYQFKNDTSSKKGLTLSYLYEGYPNVNTSHQMAEALRYITKQEEYEELMSYEEPKVAVDSFWLNIAGTPGRAMVLLKKYYHRVEDANRLFPSIREGWKTERGMMYIIFGLPNAVFRRDDFERWVYGIPGSLEAKKFDFIRVDNPFTPDYYLIDRSPGYENLWFNAVEQWRR